ncbi:MAG: pyruvate kinase [Chitinophagales bacterium]|nr:pyruvate kinase [Chitinophagales bacterium]MDW8392760.1 pyruvate kinase [Chitinophagales bacterium]
MRWQHRALLLHVCDCISIAEQVSIFAAPMAIPANRTKIIATIGPASRSELVIAEMIRAGLDVARINFSHSSHAEHQQTIDLVRATNAKLNTHVCLLGDLQGPKLRIGQVRNGQILLKPGERIFINEGDGISSAEELFISYPRLTEEVRPGERVLLDDGRLQLQVLSRSGHRLEALIIHGGPLTSRKGINFPESKLSVPALSEKDKQDLLFAVANRLEWIALSFVRNAYDVLQLKRHLQTHRSRSRVIAKIEKPEAIKNISEIIHAADGIMVARGDLGVEMDLAVVPVLQKTIVQQCIQHAKPVIIATQMMESMITQPSPTRAEANDVTNAVLDGADAVMLSAETSSGAFPVEAVRIMRKIVEVAETVDTVYGKKKTTNPSSPTYISDEVCRQACLIADVLKAKAIVSTTHSGYTAFQLSSFRPRTPIFIFTDNQMLLNMLNLLWGVRAFYYDRFTSTDDTIHDVNTLLREMGFVKPKDLVINTASMPLHARSRTNTIKVSRIDDR